MALTRKEKESIVEKLKQHFADAKSVVFVNFHGLNVGDETEMRRDLSQVGVEYTVAKKTLTSIALDDVQVDGERPLFDGELALAFGNDLTTPAREIYEHGKKYDGAVSIMGGIFEGVFKNKEEMNEIAQIPDIDTLRGMFANVINSPIQGFAIALREIAEKKS